MKRRILALILCISTLLCLCSCSGIKANSTFCIYFINVGQGDAALVECDGHFMLIDGGDKAHGQDVYNVLEDMGVQSLDILAISHLDSDHIGGLPRALTFASRIGRTISNATYRDSDAFRDLQNQLNINNSKITVPAAGDKYRLGSATVNVIDVCDNQTNDSLVLLITYGKTRFLFSGDIQRNGQLRVIQALQNNPKHRYTDEDPNRWESLIKMPHHGAFNNDYGQQDNALWQLFREYYPSYFVISVGENNQYHHPHQRTMEYIETMVIREKNLDWDSHVRRTDEDGDIIVRSNGREIFIEPV